MKKRQTKAAAKVEKKVNKGGITKSLLDESRKYATTILRGLNASPSHFHAV